jgi:hypothetical protein
MFPIGRPGHSPFVWEAVWPGDTAVEITNVHDPSKPRHYTSTIAAASAVGLGAYARASGGQGLYYFKVTYNKGGKHYIVKCQPLKHTETSKLVPLY